MNVRKTMPCALLLALAAAGCGTTQQAAVDPTTTVTQTPQAPTGTTGTAGTSGTPTGGPAQQVPEQLRFTAKTVDGKDFDGASLAGRPAVLWFWAPWCPKCRAEADEIASIARDHSGKVTFLGVAAQDQVPAMQEFVRQYGVDFAHIADTDAAVWRRFGVTVQPAYAFVDSTGKVDVVKSQLGRDELADRVAALS